MHELTEHEVSIARYIGRGYTQAEIAEELSVSPRTIKAHAEKIRLKLGVRKSREIPRVLRELGIID